MNHLPIYLRRLGVLTCKELLQVWRDRILLVFITFVFTLDIYLAGSGVTLQLKQAALGLRDMDQSFTSRELVSRFPAPYFDYQGEVNHARDAQAMLDRGQLMVALEIPAGFEADLESGRCSEAQLLIDTTNSVQGLLAHSFANRIIHQFGLEIALHRLARRFGPLSRLPEIQQEYRVWFNPNQEDSWFMSLSQLFNVISLLAILLPATAMAREKERGTIEQLLVSPLSPFQIVVPKIFAMSAIILAGTGLSLGLVIEGIFRVPLRGSLALFFTLTLLYVFTTAGLGLLIATVTRNLTQVGMLTILVFVPLLLLSGAWTPPEAMPWWMSRLMLFSPLHYYMDAAFGILLKGAGLRLLWPSFGCLAGLGGAIFLAVLLRFRGQFSA